MRRWLLDWLYPPVCAACEAPLMGCDDPVLCPACHDEMPWHYLRACSYCGAYVEQSPREREKTSGRCPRCRLYDWRFTRAVGVVRYGGPARALVLGLKFRHERGRAASMGRLIARRVADAGVPRCDLVTPVALCTARRRERGYNQSELLAETASEALGWPLRRKCLRRLWTTPTQMGKTAEERRRFPADVFAGRDVPQGSRVLLVDDVLTTGATASAAAGALLKAGASEVYVAAFAR